MKLRLISVGLILTALPAFAQQQTQHVDQRLAAPLIQALQSQLSYSEALLKAQQQDATSIIKKLCEAVSEDKRKDLDECKKTLAENQPKPAVQSSQ